MRRSCHCGQPDCGICNDNAELAYLAKQYRTMIHNHIHRGSPLTRKIITEILSVFPEIGYSGKAYRVLSFSQNQPAQCLDDDLSFSIGLLSACKFGSTLDHNFIHLYEANVWGLDLISASSVIGQFSDGDVVTLEQEVIAVEVYDTQLLFSGSFDEFWNKYLKGI